jgi:RNase P subunit RPR2
MSQHDTTTDRDTKTLYCHRCTHYTTHDLKPMKTPSGALLVAECAQCNTRRDV